MGTVADALTYDLAELKAQATESLIGAANDLVAWCDLVRDPQKPWAFRWANESTREANVAATNYILQAASWCGVLDRVLTQRQKEEGAAWIHSMRDGTNSYTDPGLVGRKPPAWNDAEENWPPDGADASTGAGLDSPVDDHRAIGVAVRAALLWRGVCVRDCLTEYEPRRLKSRQRDI